MIDAPGTVNVKGPGSKHLKDICFCFLSILEGWALRFFFLKGVTNLSVEKMVMFWFTYFPVRTMKKHYFDEKFNMIFFQSEL